MNNLPIETYESVVQQRDALEKKLMAYEQADKTTDLKTLVISEIVDFYAGFESPGEPETVDEAQSQLIKRVENVFGLAAPVLPKQPELIGMKVSIDTGSDNIGHRLFGEIVGTSDSNGVPVLCIEVAENNGDMAAPAQPVNPAMQPLQIDGLGTLRFKQNTIVRKLLDYATAYGYGLNEIALEQFEADDRMQLAQLIGYSLTGYGELSYVTDNSYERAASAEPAQPVSEPYKLPDGWKLVPIEPTENMIIEGFESEPNETFSKPEVWEEYAAMSGCKQAAHRAKLCWAAMLSAAPTAQESE